MASPQTVLACGEHKVTFGDKTAESLKRLERGQWIHAAVLGANDGLLSTTLLMLGVGAAKEDQWSMVLSGIAGAVAGASSMAVGEFVSVSTQRDIQSSVMDISDSEAKFSSETNHGDVKIQVTPLADPSDERTKVDVFITSPSMNPSRTPIPQPKFPHFLSPARSPMMKVVMRNARTSTVEEAEKYVEDRKESLPNPNKAAAASAVSFLCGSFFPLLAAILVCDNVFRNIVIVVVASLALAFFGVIGAFLGGTSLRLSAIRVLLGGWIVMAITYSLLKPLDKDDKGGKDQNLQHG